MKNKFIFLLCVLLSKSLFSQAQTEIALFQVDQLDYVQASNFEPSSTFKLYSSNDGGKLCGTSQTDANGFYQESFETELTPAFLLNKKMPGNQVGNNKVYFLGKKEFVLSSVQFVLDQGISEMTWQAQVNEGNNISFQILKSIDNDPYQVVYTANGMQGNGQIAYSFTDTYQGDTKYLLRVLKDGNKFRYEKIQQQAMNRVAFVNAINSDIKVYPTKFEELLFVDIPRSELPAELSIREISGKIVFSKHLDEIANSLDVSFLSRGNYVVSLNSNNKTKVFKIIK